MSPRWLLPDTPSPLQSPVGLTWLTPPFTSLPPLPAELHFTGLKSRPGNSEVFQLSTSTPYCDRTVHHLPIVSRTQGAFPTLSITAFHFQIQQTFRLFCEFFLFTFYCHITNQISCFFLVFIMLRIFFPSALRIIPIGNIQLLWNSFDTKTFFPENRPSGAEQGWQLLISPSVG